MNWCVQGVQLPSGRAGTWAQGWHLLCVCVRTHAHTSTCLCAHWGRCSSGRPKSSPSPSPLLSCQGGARPQDVCRLYSAWALTQAALIHGRMGRAAGTVGRGKDHTALSHKWNTPLSKFRGGVGAWPGAQACLYPTSTSDRPGWWWPHKHRLLQGGNTAAPSGRLGMGGLWSSCLVRVHWRNTKKDRNYQPNKGSWGALPECSLEEIQLE